MGKENQEYFQRVIPGPDGKLKTTDEGWDAPHRPQLLRGGSVPPGGDLPVGRGQGSPHAPPKTGLPHTGLRSEWALSFKQGPRSKGQTQKEKQLRLKGTDS